MMSKDFQTRLIRKRKLHLSWCCYFHFNCKLINIPIYKQFSFWIHPALNCIIPKTFHARPIVWLLNYDNKDNNVVGVAQTLMFWSYVWTLIWYTQWVHWHVNWLEMTWLLQIYINSFCIKFRNSCVSQNFRGYRIKQFHSWTIKSFVNTYIDMT